MGERIGTPAFMSPEQAAGRLDELGPASDVYSLGATLYCLSSGRFTLRSAGKQKPGGSFKLAGRLRISARHRRTCQVSESMTRSSRPLYLPANVFQEDPGPARALASPGR